ncbi:MAG: hypothetical protein M3Y17_02055, partial [Actinomycetota bacterium]|nr:hypothetical protein [Actinomycetota bacterium]
ATQSRHGIRPGDQATSTPTTTDAKWGHFKRPRWGQCKRPLRVAELRAQSTWRTIGDQLGPIKQGRFRSPDGEFTQRTELSAEQRQLLKTLGVPEPPRFGQITPAAAPRQTA